MVNSGVTGKLSRWSAARRAGLIAAVLAALTGPALGARALAEETPPGGFVESADSTATRPRATVALPERGRFTFPAPYSTTGVRLTNASDCGGRDCVWYVGYSYWRRMNNHVGSDSILVFLTLDPSRGGTGPTLFRYDKSSGQVTVLGPLFSPSSPFYWATGEGWYFSASLPSTLYLDDGVRLYRYDVLSRGFETVFDISAEFGPNRYMWQYHSSSDDSVHSATLRESGTDRMLGCLVYREATRAFSFFARSGDFDECQIDKSGRWLVIKDNVDGQYGEDNVIVDLASGVQTTFRDQNGAAGHSDTGMGYMVAEDNFYPLPGAVRLWTFGQPFPTAEPGSGSQGQLVYHTTDWNADIGHLSHANARAGTPASQQYACGANASRANLPRNNEVVCFPLDGSLRVLVVAPVMTDLGAPGGGDDYAKSPKGNLDVTGEYFIWTSNAGGDRLDAFIVRVPAQHLTGAVSASPSPDTTAPTVSITAPLRGTAVSGTVAVSASASDDGDVARVQFTVDGVNLGAAITSPPFGVAWNTALVANGPHVVVAVAWDAAGNSASSAPLAVTVANRTSTATSTVLPVAWTDAVNVTVDGNSLRKTSGCDGCADAGAVSRQRMSSRGGYVEFTASETDTLRYVGLGRGSAAAPSMDFGLRLQSGYAEVREQGVYRADIAFGPGDVFRITIKKGVVNYFKNGTRFYTSAVTPSFPLGVNASLANLGATVQNVVLYTGR